MNQGDPAVITDHGVFCLSCARLLHEEEAFTVYEEVQLDAYPVCEHCGRKHIYPALTPLGERFELEVQGPQPDDVMLTACGPNDAMTELSIVDDGVVAVFPPSKQAVLSEMVERYRRDHPDATIWRISRTGVVELAPRDAYAAPSEVRDYLVNTQDDV